MSSLDALKAAHERELARVSALGREIGFGNLMVLAELAWEREDDQRGGHFVVGPCASSTMACPHNLMVMEIHSFVFDENGHCKWCCGCGWVTKAVWEHVNRYALGPMCEVVKIPTGGDK